MVNVDIFHTKRETRRQHPATSAVLALFYLFLHDVKADASSSNLCSKDSIQNICGLSQSHNIILYPGFYTSMVKSM